MSLTSSLLFRLQPEEGGENHMLINHMHSLWGCKDAGCLLIQHQSWVLYEAVVCLFVCWSELVWAVSALVVVVCTLQAAGCVLAFTHDWLRVEGEDLMYSADIRGYAQTHAFEAAQDTRAPGTVNNDDHSPAFSNTSLPFYAAGERLTESVCSSCL